MAEIDLLMWTCCHEPVHPPVGRGPHTNRKDHLNKAHAPQVNVSTYVLTERWMKWICNYSFSQIQKRALPHSDVELVSASEISHLTDPLFLTSVSRGNRVPRGEAGLTWALFKDWVLTVKFPHLTWKRQTNVTEGNSVRNLGFRENTGFTSLVNSMY